MQTTDSDKIEQSPECVKGCTIEDVSLPIVLPLMYAHECDV